MNVPGEVLLLHERHGAGGLFRLRCGAPSAAGDLPIDGADVWSRAAEAVGRSVRLLWRSPRLRDGTGLHPLRPLPGVAPHAQLVAEDRDDGVLPPIGVLQGGSFGLSFALGQASLLWSWPLPVDVAASAVIGPDGSLTRVGGLKEKVRAVVRLAPQVSRLLVAEEQLAEAQGIVASVLAEQRAELGVELALAPIGCADLAAALRRVRPRLADEWAATGADERTRRDHIERLVLLALARRDELVDWHPVREAARSARAAWTSATSSERWSLAFAEAVAARHHGDAVDLPLPTPETLLQLPQPRRVDVLAHFVQQATDTGRPDPKALVSLAGEHLARGLDAFPVHLALLGALGRLHANLGDPEHALELQLEAAVGWLDRPAHVGVSYPLSEGYRLAGLLVDAGAFERVERLDRQARAEGHLTPSDHPWVDVPRARALLALGRPDGARALLEPISRTCPTTTSPPWAFGALRAHHALELASERGAAEQLRRELAEGVTNARDQVAGSADSTARQRFQTLARDLETCLHLIELDLAHAAGAPGLDHARELEALHPELTTFLRRGRADAEWPRALAREFPYG